MAGIRNAHKEVSMRMFVSVLQIIIAKHELQFRCLVTEIVSYMCAIKLHV